MYRGYTKKCKSHYLKYVFRTVYMQIHRRNCKKKKIIKKYLTNTEADSDPEKKK